MPALEPFWGPVPDDQPPPTVAAVLVSLVGEPFRELRAERSERVEWKRGLVKSVQALAQGEIDVSPGGLP